MSSNNLTVIHGEKGTITGDEIYAEIHKVMERMLPCLDDDDPCACSLRILARAAKPWDA